MLRVVSSEPSDPTKSQIYMFSRAKAILFVYGRSHVPKYFHAFLNDYYPRDGGTTYRIPLNH